MENAAKRLKGRLARHRRLRKKISGTELRPRLAVFRSAMHIYVQAVDDIAGRTIAASSTAVIKKSLKKTYTGNKDAAKAVGADVAKKLLDKSISSVVFDRGGFVYHGRVQALAEGAREAGLKF
ncbi:MAG: 50S ribosomal protein L18 [SAR324 cluster bacterium]|nr:50S ribosomal protein L18 [SAR324 cluster bacterium]MEC9011084.1 50S ribosomal protein L18 [SAR324 cluster bacterium]MED5482348.1 50S ribosomal protein L18 [SAR324 cluster bacterium]